MFFTVKNFLFSILTTIIGSIKELPRVFSQNSYSYADEWSASAEDNNWDNKRKWLHWGPISAMLVTSMIGLAASILHVSWWDITTVFGFLDFIIFLTWNYLVLRNLNQACELGGGYIKFGWHPKDKEDWALLRYCHNCMCYKVPRSHHCSRCKRCVLMMDHHCPWTNNCVGRRNQFRFIRFLCFAVIGCIHAAIILTSCLYQVITFLIDSTPENYSGRHLYEPPNLPITSIPLFILAVLAIGLAYGVIIAVSILLFMQLRSLYLNVTGIEQMFDERQPPPRRTMSRNRRVKVKRESAENRRTKST